MANEQTVTIEVSAFLSRMMLYILSAMLVASLLVSLALAAVVRSALRESTTYRLAAYESMETARTCDRQLNRATSQLEMVDNLFNYGRTAREAAGGRP